MESRYHYRGHSVAIKSRNAMPGRVRWIYEVAIRHPNNAGVYARISGPDYSSGTDAVAAAAEHANAFIELWK